MLNTLRTSATGNVIREPSVRTSICSRGDPPGRVGCEQIAGGQLPTPYHEKVTEGYKRLNDQPWAQEMSQAAPPDVAWMKDLVVR